VISVGRVKFASKYPIEELLKVIVEEILSFRDLVREMRVFPSNFGFSSGIEELTLTDEIMPVLFKVAVPLFSDVVDPFQNRSSGTEAAEGQ
jgi:hypothetical protein